MTETTTTPWTENEVDRYARVLAAAGGDDDWIDGRKADPEFDPEQLLEDYRGDARAMLTALANDGRLRSVAETDLLRHLTAALNIALSYARPDGPQSESELAGCVEVLGDAVRAVHGPDAKSSQHPHLASQPRNAAVITWDHREQPDLDELARAVRDMTGGILNVQEANTRSDQYAIVLSTAPLDEATADAVYNRWRKAMGGLGDIFPIDPPETVA